MTESMTRDRKPDITSYCPLAADPGFPGSHAWHPSPPCPPASSEPQPRVVAECACPTFEHSPKRTCHCFCHVRPVAEEVR